MVLEDLPNSLGQTTQTADNAAANALLLVNDPVVLLAGLGLIVLTVLLILFLKRVIVNSILGGILWVLSTYVFHIELPFFASLLVSILFGPAGLGALMVLGFLGLV